MKDGEVVRMTERKEVVRMTEAILTFDVDHFEFPIGIKTIITCKGL